MLNASGGQLWNHLFGFKCLIKSTPLKSKYMAPHIQCPKLTTAYMKMMMSTNPPSSSFTRCRRSPSRLLNNHPLPHPNSPKPIYKILVCTPTHLTSFDMCRGSSAPPPITIIRLLNTPPPPPPPPPHTHTHTHTQTDSNSRAPTPIPTPPPWLFNNTHPSVQIVQSIYLTPTPHYPTN